MPAPAKKPWAPQKLNSGNPTIDNQDAGIQLAYKLLEGQLNKGAGATSANYAGATSKVSNAYDTSRGMVQDAGRSLAAQLGSQFDELGLGSTTADALAGLQAEKADQVGDLDYMKGIDLASLQRERSGYENADRQAVVGSQREMAQSRVTARTDLEKVLAQMRAEEERARGDVEIARIQAEAAKAEAAQRAADRRAASAPNPMDALNAQSKGLDIQEKELGIQGLLMDMGIIPDTRPRDAEGAPGPGDLGNGRLGLGRFLDTPQPEWGEAAGPRVRSVLDDIIGKSHFQDTPGWYPGGDNTQDPYTEYQYAQRQLSQYPYMNRRLLDTGLQVYFNKSR